LKFSFSQAELTPEVFLSFTPSGGSGGRTPISASQVEGMCFRPPTVNKSSKKGCIHHRRTRAHNSSQRQQPSPVQVRHIPLIPSERRVSTCTEGLQRLKREHTIGSVGVSHVHFMHIYFAKEHLLSLRQLLRVRGAWSRRTSPVGGTLDEPSCIDETKLH